MTGDLSSTDLRYVAARRILLDALTALAPHNRAIVIAGAQAIYLQTGEADLDISVAPFTTDGDLVVNPSLLGDDPVLEAAMGSAGFHLSPQDGGHVEPGIWLAPATIGGEEVFVPVDLIVPEGAYEGGGRRGARLGPHGNRAARRAVGLEAALIDHAPTTIIALDPSDTRSVVADVAGVAALFVAKAHKIHDRVASGRDDRLVDKDAADVIRLMLASRAQDIARTFVTLSADAIAGPPTENAITYIEELFGRRGRPGLEMASRALRLALPPERIVAIGVAYVRALSEEIANVRRNRTDSEGTP